MTAAEIAAQSGIPEQVIVEKFGLRGKHIAAPDEHVSDLSVKAIERLLDETGFDPKQIDVVMYYGSMWRDHAVWQVAPHIAHRIGATNAFAMEYDNVSHGTPIALRVARDMLRAEPELTNVLVVAACRESYLLDYENAKSRFMFNFGDGAVAGLLVGGAERNQVLGSHAITNGAYSLQVKIARGSVEPDGYRFLDVQDPAEMKGGLDQESLPNFVAVARGAAERSGLTLADLDFVCLLHTKRSMFDAVLAALGMTEEQAVYLDDTGHMSGVDSLLGLDRAVREGRVVRRRRRAAPLGRHRLHVGRHRGALGRRAVSATDRYVETNGIRLHYLDHAGAGPTLVLAPGLTANAHSFDGLMRAGLGDVAHVLALDMRGRGESDAPATGYAMEDHARDVLGLLDALELERVVMGGHSFGGLLTYWLAANHPERVERCVVIDAPAGDRPGDGRADPAVARPPRPRLPVLGRVHRARPRRCRTSPTAAGTPTSSSYFRADVARAPRRDGAGALPPGAHRAR